MVYSTIKSYIIVQPCNLPDSQCQVLLQPPQDGSGYGAQKQSNTCDNTIAIAITQGGSECGALKQSITYNVQCRAPQVFVTK